MSEQLLRFLLSELTTVRIVCRGRRGASDCGAVYEFPIDRLDSLHRSLPECPLCHTPFGVPPPAAGVAVDGFGPFLEAVRGLVRADKQFHVQFILPQPPVGPAAS